MMPDKSGNLPTDTRSTARATPLALLLLAASACTPPEPVMPRPPADVLAPECTEWAHVQESVAELALHAMRTFGRIDPKLYRRDGEGPIRRDPEIQPLALAAPEPFDTALAKVNAQPPARDGLARGLGAAELLCGETGCPPVAYSISVDVVDASTDADRMWAWVVKDENMPSGVQWKAFMATYASEPELCPVPRSIAVRTRASGFAQTAGLLNHPVSDATEATARKETTVTASAHSHSGGGNPCKCPYMSANQRNGSECTTCPGYAYFQASSECYPEE